MAEKLSQEGKTLKFKINLFIIKRFKLSAIVLVLIFFAIGFFFFIKPQRSHLVRFKQGEFKEKIDARDSKKLELEKLKTKTKDFDIVKSQRLQSMSDLLPYENKSENLFVIIKQMVIEQGLKLNALTFGKPESAIGYADKGMIKLFSEDFSQDIANLNESVLYMPVAVEVSKIDGGFIGYDDIKNFLLRLKQASRIFSVANIEISGEDDANATMKESKESFFELDFYTFMRQDPE